MSTLDHKKVTVPLIALLGAVALLMWLSRSEPSVDRGGRSGGRDRAESDLPPLDLWLRAHDRILVGADRVEVELPMAVSLARAAGHVNLHVAGDVRHGWHEIVVGALTYAGVDVVHFDLISPGRLPDTSDPREPLIQR